MSSSSKTSFKTLSEYLYQEGKTFVVPNYQRGYKWSVKEKETEPSHVEKLCDDLIKAHIDDLPEYFLQGITVSEKDGEIVLVDGQQRTTTLYLLLWCLEKNRIESIKLNYDIRESSMQFIKDLRNPEFQLPPPVKTDNQDIHYFKVAIEQIKKKTAGLTADFADYILDHVKILYIDIEHEKAVRTFTMMNGSKATMLPVELIKAEMLRLVSLPNIEKKDVSTSVDENLMELREIIARDWETNALRSRYAREWDKWLYWWNRDDVKSYFGIANPIKSKPMGLLLEYHLRSERTDEGKAKQNFTFQNFKELLLQNEDNNKNYACKEQFKKLRDLQKSFEDLFNSPRIHNYLKLALICAKEDEFTIIQYFIENKKKMDTLRDYSKWRLIGATHMQITQSETQENDRITKEDMAQEVLSQLSGPLVYGAYNDWALKQLLRLNVEEDNQLNSGSGRKFDFEIYGNKSLEHVYPKSKVYHKKEDGVYYTGDDKNIANSAPTGPEWLNRDDFEGIGSEHCIGNLVLLDKNENAQFNDKPFHDKKQIYFNIEKGFKSRNLLHSISVFARSDWNIESIKATRLAFIARFKEDYKPQEGGSNV